MSGKRICYKRVSSKDQNPVSQLTGMIFDEEFIEYASGKDIERPVLQNMLHFIRKDDELYIHRIDRLARNIRDLLDLIKKITSKQVKVYFVSENLVFDGSESPIAKLTLSLMATFAEFERQISRERQTEGIESAKARGVYKGRKPVFAHSEIKAIKEKVKDIGWSVARTAREFNVSPKTIYKYLKY